MAYYEAGSTIRINAEFHDWGDGLDLGDLINPDPGSVTLSIFDATRTLITTATPTADGLGTFYYDWVLPEEPGSYYVEVLGMVEGKPQVARQKIKVKWDVI